MSFLKIHNAEFAFLCFATNQTGLESASNLSVILPVQLIYNFPHQ